MTTLILFLLATGAHAESHTWDKGDRLTVSNGAGDVEISVGGKSIEVETEHRQGKCVVEFGDKGGATLQIRPEKKSGQCSMDVKVKMPASADLTLELGAGDVEINGLRGQATVQLGAGDLELDVGAIRAEIGAGDIEGTASGEAFLTVGAGSIDLAGLSAPIAVQAGAGSVELSFDKAPKGEIQVAAGVGSVDIDLPDDTVVDADLPDSAKMKLEIEKGSATQLEVVAGLGSVRVN